MAIKRKTGVVILILDQTDFKIKTGTSLVLHWLRLHTPNAGDLGSIPGQGTRSHMLQLRFHMPQQKISHATRQIEEPFC